jgi:uncharacterized membrane protein YadS
MGKKYCATMAPSSAVKLARALGILPLSVFTSVLLKNRAKIHVPWFIPFFCLAALLNSAFPGLRPEFIVASKLGQIGLSITLFLIGASLSIESLKRVGVRPLLQGLLLWIVVGTTTLGLILLHWIHG